MEVGIIFINACITILSLAIVLLSFGSYRKYKKQKLMLITSAFCIFLAKGLLLSLGMFYSDLRVVIAHPYFGVFDVFILAFIFISTIK